ncbi:MAG: glycerophosphodiester phosphodiesterase family protein [Chlorobiaceae bacterium]
MTFEIQAHRGARSFFPENTLQAFCKAAELKVRVVELDLVVSRDSRIVVSHDPWIAIPSSSGTPRHLIIHEMDYADVAAFDCGIPDPSFPGQMRVRACKPLLSEVFGAVEARMAELSMTERMSYNLEIKSWPGSDGALHPSPERYAELVVDEVMAAGLSGFVRIQSFDDRVVREAWKINPALSCGILVDEGASLEEIEGRLSTLGFKPRYVNPHFSLVDRKLATFLHRQGIEMIPWTVNRREEMQAMLRCGADGIITDFPEKALALPELFD